jgi:hypothetical protein
MFEINSRNTPLFTSLQLKYFSDISNKFYGIDEVKFNQMGFEVFPLHTTMRINSYNPYVFSSKSDKKNQTENLISLCARQFNNLDLDRSINNLILLLKEKLFIESCVDLNSDEVKELGLNTASAALCRMIIFGVNYDQIRSKYINPGDYPVVLISEEEVDLRDFFESFFMISGFATLQESFNCYRLLISKSRIHFGLCKY